MMWYRQAEKGDFAAIQPLWQAAFDDSESYIQGAIEGFTGWEGLYVACDDAGKLTALLNAVPCECDSCKGVYLFALATAAGQRGKGIMSGLMEYAERQSRAKGARFACLVPASAPLFSFYSKRGYTTELPLRWVERDIPADLLATAEFDTVTAKAWPALRASLLEQPFVAFSESQSILLLQDLYSMGASTVRTKRACGVYFAKGDSLWLPELLADSTASALSLLQAVREKTGCTKAVFTLPAASSVFSGEGRLKSLGLLKKLDDGFTAQDIYLRFGFEVQAEPD